ncbi:MAG: hypothetical protein AAGE80_13420 [Pseudomonadota bacterium]
MQNDLDFSKMDLTTAVRAAHARAQVERAKETRAFFKAVSGAIRDLFTPKAAIKTKDA